MGYGVAIFRISGCMIFCVIVRCCSAGLWLWFFAVVGSSLVVPLVCMCTVWVCTRCALSMAFDYTLLLRVRL
jgi:hypothetical protein